MEILPRFKDRKTAITVNIPEIIANILFLVHSNRGNMYNKVYAAFVTLLFCSNTST